MAHFEYPYLIVLHPFITASKIKFLRFSLHMIFKTSNYTI